MLSLEPLNKDPEMRLLLTPEEELNLKKDITDPLIIYSSTLNNQTQVKQYQECLPPVGEI